MDGRVLHNYLCGQLLYYKQNNSRKYEFELSENSGTIHQGSDNSGSQIFTLVSLRIADQPWGTVVPKVRKNSTPWVLPGQYDLLGHWSACTVGFGRNEHSLWMISQTDVNGTNISFENLGRFFLIRTVSHSKTKELKQMR